MLNHLCEAAKLKGDERLSKYVIFNVRILLDFVVQFVHSMKNIL